MNVKHLDHLNMTVTSFDETAAWYREVFGFEVVEEGVQRDKRWGVIRAGDAMLCIYEHPNRHMMTDEEHRDQHIHGIGHFGLRITDRVSWEAKLAGDRPAALRYAELYYWRWPHSEAWYVTDPSGYEIEVALWDEDTVRFEHGAAVERA